MNDAQPVERGLWFAQPLPGGNGFTWTLSSRLGDALNRAEQLYGPRNPSYTPLGVEFGGQWPQLWFPGNRRHIIVQITPDCATDWIRACYQLAHECVHILSPTEQPPTTILEEGLATHFANRYLIEQGLANGWYDPRLDSYRAAQALVESLLKIDGEIVRRLRQDGRPLHQVSVADICASNSAVPAAMARALAQKFRR